MKREGSFPIQVDSEHYQSAPKLTEIKNLYFNQSPTIPPSTVPSSAEVSTMDKSMRRPLPEDIEECSIQSEQTVQERASQVFEFQSPSRKEVAPKSCFELEPERETRGLLQKQNMEELYPGDTQDSVKLWTIVRLGIPAVISSIIFFLQEIVNLVFAGHMQNKTVLAAIGLGNMIQNCVVVATFMSFNQAIETLVTQAAGGGKHELCGVYLARGFTVMTIVFVILGTALVCCESVLSSMGQDQAVSQMTQSYILSYLPGLYLFGLCDLLRRYLNSYSKYFFPMLSFTVSVGLHPFWCYYFVDVQGYLLGGIAFAGIITNLITLVSMRSLQLCTSQEGDLSSKLRFDSRMFDGLGEYIMIGLPLLFVQILDYWGWEFMTLASGFIGVREQAAQVVLINMAAMAYMVGYGLQSTMTTLIGNYIGRGDTQKAKRYYSVGMGPMVANVALMMVLHYYFGRKFMEGFTDIEEIIDEAMLCLPIFLINLIPDCVRTQMRGVIKGLGLQAQIIGIHIFCQGLLNSVLLWLIAFHWEQGLRGIWISKVICDSIITAYYFYVVGRANWEEIGDAAIKRQAKSIEKKDE